MSSLLNLRFDNDIAFVELNRPDKANAINMAMFHQLDKALRVIRSKRHLRAVCIQSTNADFSTGIDVKSTLSDPIAAARLLFKWTPWCPNLAQRVCVGWKSLAIPVLCAVRGRCWGAGLQMALGADVRVIHSNTSMAIMEPKWGLIPDMGGSLALRALMPLDQAIKITMTTNEVNAQDALAHGLATEIDDDPETRIHALATQLCERSPDTLASIKRQYHYAWNQHHSTVLMREWLEQLYMLISPNQRIATQRSKGNTQAAFKRRLM